MKRTGLFAALGLLVSLLFSGLATAAPMVPGPALGDVASADALVQRVHGCHARPAIGPEVGQCHIHVGPACIYEQVPMHHCRRGYDGRRYYEPRPARCWTDCRWIRGERICERVCR